MGLLYSYRKQYSEAISYCEKAIAVNPNAANSYAVLGFILMYDGSYGKAALRYNKAIRLNPYPPGWYYIGLALLNWVTGKYDEAISICKNIIADPRRPDTPFPHLILATTYMSLGRKADAQVEVGEIFRTDPDASLDRLLSVMYWKDAKIQQRIADNLRKAGLR